MKEDSIIVSNLYTYIFYGYEVLPEDVDLQDYIQSWVYRQRICYIQCQEGNNYVKLNFPLQSIEYASLL